jgi:hypothetical protein
MERLIAVSPNCDWLGSLMKEVRDRLRQFVGQWPAERGPPDNVLIEDTPAHYNLLVKSTSHAYILTSHTIDVGLHRPFPVHREDRRILNCNIHRDSSHYCEPGNEAQILHLNISSRQVIIIYKESLLIIDNYL